MKGKYFSSLIPMLEQCDFVCVACPLTDETRHIIDKEQFQHMKRTAIFCNVSRGGTVNQDALCSALQEQKIFAAALDVTGSDYTFG